jgi:hypothetical protein
MKLLITLLSCFVLLGCNHSISPDEVNGALRTESTEFTKPSVGKVTIATTYRGDERILMVMTYSNITTRTFCLHGEPVYVESDENGDGFFESLMIAGETMDDFEQFTRKPDGTVEPISKEAFLEMKMKAHEATLRMKQAFKDANKEP